MYTDYENYCHVVDQKENLIIYNLSTSFQFNILNKRDHLWQGGTRCSTMDGPRGTVCSALDGPRDHR